MRKIEITVPLELSREQEQQLAYHSFVNVVNVLYGELQLLADLIARPESFEPLLQECTELLRLYREDGALQMEVERIEGFCSRIEKGSRLIAREASEDRVDLAVAVEEVLRHIREVLRIMDMRVRELLARRGVAGSYVYRSASEIRNGLQEVLDAMAHHARGHFGIVFRPDEQNEHDYLVEIEVHGRRTAGGEEQLYLPEALIDSFRDLTANARKYSAPGSRIHAELYDQGTTVIMKITDEGRGIPEDEIEKVIEFGFRASNTRPFETKGGGFGLTKAYYICRQYGGRMWIESGISDGTRITIEIPTSTVPSAQTISDGTP